MARPAMDACRPWAVAGNRAGSLVWRTCIPRSPRRLRHRLVPRRPAILAACSSAAAPSSAAASASPSATSLSRAARRDRSERHRSAPTSPPGGGDPASRRRRSARRPEAGQLDVLPIKAQTLSATSTGAASSSRSTTRAASSRATSSTRSSSSRGPGSFTITLREGTRRRAKRDLHRDRRVQAGPRRPRRAGARHLHDQRRHRRRGPDPVTVG